MRGQSISSASFQRIGRSLRKKDSITCIISSRKPLRIRVEGIMPTPRSTDTMVVREFYANLVVHTFQKVTVQGVLVDFSTNSINEFYNLELANNEAYDRVQENPNYPKVLRLLTNG